jgi:DNA-binding LacI/PurR family transcriptional regulator
MSPSATSTAGKEPSRPIARLAPVNLTAVGKSTQQQAEHAVAAAVERLDDGRTAHRKVVLSPRLVVRGTTGPPR